MQNKHAYMIVAHNDFEIVTELLKELDHERNDIFLHIDKKTKEFPEEKLKKTVTKARLFIVPRMSVNWGGYSQIACEIHLMKEAISQGKHVYYHLLTGATIPLKDQNKILEFFDSHMGNEFIGYDNSKDYGGRVQCYNIFNEIGKADTKKKQQKAFLRNKFRGFQKHIGFKRKETKGIQFKKGFVYWSLTEEAINYILSYESKIENMYKHSFCGDELFVHTILYYSPFKEKIYNMENEYNSCLRYVKPVRSWNPDFSGASIKQTCLPETGITKEDIPACLKSNMLFGLKFVGKDGIKAIQRLRTLREEYKE